MNKNPPLPGGVLQSVEREGLKKEPKHSLVIYPDSIVHHLITLSSYPKYEKFRCESLGLLLAGRNSLSLIPSPKFAESHLSTDGFKGEASNGPVFPTLCYSGSPPIRVCPQEKGFLGHGTWKCTAAGAWQSLPWLPHSGSLTYSHPVLMLTQMALDSRWICNPSTRVKEIQA